MLPGNLDFTCPHCRDRFDAKLVNGVGEFQCFGCKRHYRLTVAPDRDYGDFEKQEVTYETDGCRVTEWESKPQQVKLKVSLTELKDEGEYYSRHGG